MDTTATKPRPVASLSTREVMELVIARGMPSAVGATIDKTEKLGIQIAKPAFRGARAWLFMNFPEEFTIVTNPR